MATTRMCELNAIALFPVTACYIAGFLVAPAVMAIIMLAPGDAWYPPDNV